MRLRKNMKRTAAAVLALSMAVSAAAMPASAGYTIDMSDEKITGNVEIKQETDGSGTKITISVDGKDRTTEFTDDEAGDKITITGDNTVTKPAAATTADAEAAKDDTKAPETTVEENKDGTVIDYTGKQDAQPEQEASRPEGAAPDMEADPAGVDDQQEETDPEADKDDPDGQNDQNNQSGQNTQNTQNEDSEDEDADADIMTFEAPAPTTLTSAVEAAARKVISIINNVTGKELAVTLKNLKVDAGDTNKSAVTVSGTGNVTLELDGKNELKGGNQYYKKESNSDYWYGGDGLNSTKLRGDLTIQDETKDGSLTAIGGSVDGGQLEFSPRNSTTLIGGSGIEAKNLVLSGVTVEAEGGNSTLNNTQVKACGGSGIHAADGTNKLLNANITAKGGSGYSLGNGRDAAGGSGVSLVGDSTIENTSITATGGNAESTGNSGTAYSGTAMGFSSWNTDKDSLKVQGSTLNLFGSHAKAKDLYDVMSTLYINTGFASKSLKDLTITARQSTGEGSRKDQYGDYILGGYNFTVGGDSTVNLIGNNLKYKLTLNDDAVANLYTPKGETTEDTTWKDKITVSGNGGVYTYEDATVTENKDGTVTVEGTLTGLKKNEHNYTVKSVTKATCTEPGEIVYECTDENSTDTYKETIEPVGHNWEAGTVKEATCTEDGYTEYKCSACSATKHDNIKSATGHNWEAGTVKEATCTEDGYTEYKCSACSATKHDDIKSATGHNWETVIVKEATCTEDGSKKEVCSLCKEEQAEVAIPHTGHDFTEFVEVVAPTYESEGYTIYKCANCNETEKRDVVPMLVPESNGGSSAVTLTVTGAKAYETSIVDGRYIIAVPAETAVLSGCLSNLRELKAQGVNTIVFRTQLRETVLNIDSMLSLGVDDTLFTLTHNGEGASLTIGGFEHNELIH